MSTHYTFPDEVIVADSVSMDKDPSNQVASTLLGGSTLVLTLAVGAFIYGVYSGKRWLKYGAVGLAIASYLGIFGAAVES
jgi:VIT1/CCC1 family predicted Fe2+/Mn2+ transporter